MSATRDKSQKTTFVYSNLYRLYQDGREAAREAEVPASGRVLKVHDIHAEPLAVKPFKPAEFLEKRVTRPTALPPHAVPLRPVESSSQALESLKGNLKKLNELHQRLRFVLQELEDLSKEK